MRLSIVMTCVNRKAQAVNTLRSISETSVPHRDFEVVIVDDGSIPEQRLDDEIRGFDLNIKLLTIPLSEKSYVNPCVAFNLAFRHASGDAVILQNAECLHVRDVISYVLHHVKEKDYLVFSCYAITRETFERIVDRDAQSGPSPALISLYKPKRRGSITEFDGAWYNHLVHRPVYFHFLSALTRKQLEELNGFDERYADGFWYDDDEFLARVRRKGLNCRIVHPPETLPFCVHQWHEPSRWSVSDVESEQLKATNLRVLHERTLRESSWIAPLGLSNSCAPDVGFTVRNQVRVF